MKKNDRFGHVKGVEPPTRRTSATELVAVGRLLRWGYAPLP
jgi:hypothetical protein